jgi:hypothetical protein
VEAVQNEVAVLLENNGRIPSPVVAVADDAPAAIQDDTPGEVTGETPAAPAAEN